MKDFIKGAIFGAVITGVAVALTTPKTGEELREDIIDFSTDAYNKGLDKAQELKTQGMEKAHELKEQSKQKFQDDKAYINQQFDNLRNQTLNIDN